MSEAAMLHRNRDPRNPAGCGARSVGSRRSRPSPDAVARGRAGRPQRARALSFGALPEDEPTRRALHEAVRDLPADIRRKIWAVMRTGSGDYARRNWDGVLALGDTMSDENIIGDLTEEVDLHDRLMKGLYEVGAAEPRISPS